MSLNSSLREPTSSISRLLTEQLADVAGLLLKSVAWSEGALRATERAALVRWRRSMPTVPPISAADIAGICAGAALSPLLVAALVFVT